MTSSKNVLTKQLLIFHDEQTFSPAEHWPRIMTPKALLSYSQPNPLTKMSLFLIQKGIQGIVGTLYTKVCQKAKIRGSSY